MQDPFFAPAISGWGFGAALIALLFLLIALWSLAWKLLALWHAAQNKQRYWFIAILLFNTVGILEIVYLAWFRKDRSGEGSKHLFPFLSPYVDDLRQRAAARMPSTTKQNENKED